MTVYNCLLLLFTETGLTEFPRDIVYSEKNLTLSQQHETRNLGNYCPLLDYRSRSKLFCTCKQWNSDFGQMKPYRKFLELYVRELILYLLPIYLL